MPKIVTTDDMRAIEKATDAQGHSYADMMEMAGRAVATRAAALIASLDAPRVAILVGPGNNGGDGLVAGRVLREEHAGVTVDALLLQPRDAKKDKVFAAAQKAGVNITIAGQDAKKNYAALKDMIAGADVVLDALFGTSVRLPLKGDVVDVLATVRAALDARRSGVSPSLSTPAGADVPASARPVTVIAVDLPTGLSPDTGELDEAALFAGETVTFGAAKPGLLAFPGAEAVGLLHVADIGMPADLPELEGAPLLIDAAEVGARLPQRPRDSHKGTFGKTMIVAGSLNYTGAAYLAASGAYRSGAGLVTVAAPQIIMPILAGMLPEATWILLPHDMGVLNQAAVKVLRGELAGYTAMLLGPGFGLEETTGEFLRELLQPREERRPARTIGFAHSDDEGAAGEETVSLPPIIIDADGLNLLSEIEDWPALLPPDTILTPHPGEFGRLAGMDTADVQADRLALARDKAAEWNVLVVLKGAHTVIAAPDGRVAVSPFASAALARAGTGDVLSGMIASLRGQGLEPFDAALCAVWLHGAAGERAATLAETTTSTVASDLLEHLPHAVHLAERARSKATPR